MQAVELQRPVVWYGLDAVKRTVPPHFGQVKVPVFWPAEAFS